MCNCSDKLSCDELSDARMLKKVQFATTPIKRFLGLVGKRVFDGILVLYPCSDLHTFGMRMYIDVAFIDSQGVVVKLVRNLPPRARVRCKNSVAVLERCASDEPWVSVGDVLSLFALTPP